MSAEFDRFLSFDVRLERNGAALMRLPICAPPEDRLGRDYHLRTDPRCGFPGTAEGRIEDR